MESTFGLDDDRTLVLEIIDSWSQSSNNSNKRRRLSEEVPLMNLVKYAYSNNLPTTFDALLDLLLIADKFEPLIDAAKQFLVANYKELDKYKDEVLNLSLIGIQAVLSSDDLIVTSESDVYDLVLGWARKHYPDVEERREILKTHLLNLVRFPFMTTKKLVEEVQSCVDIDPEFASKIVVPALCFKTGTPHQKTRLIAKEGNRQFVKRAYIHRPIEVVTFELPRHQHCVVYFDLTREELKNMFPEGRIRSEIFHLGGLELYLFVECSIGAGGHRYFWMSLNMKGSTRNTVEYNIALIKNSSKMFETLFQSAIKWEDFIGDDSDYFINDILQLKVDLTLKYDHLDNIVA